ncbi:MAG: hypothetical protein ABI165_06940 [Bryobacteraceae bacterium]
MQTIFYLATVAFAQHVEVHHAPLAVMPGQVDSNSPAFWNGGQLNLINSTGNGPVLSQGSSQLTLGIPQGVELVRQRPWPAWIESAWVDTNGTILAWYHQEHEGVCGPPRPAQPQIGAAISYDNGTTFWDQGVVLASGDPIDCSSQNGYISGGNGDFSVILDRDGTYFYFLFTNYGGPVQTQGIAVARMAFTDRYNPSGSVHKYFQGAWSELGIGGRVTPVFPAHVSWQSANADSFWGPAVHWNRYLETYVMLLNRSCCAPGFPQEGIYVSFNPDQSNPAAWSTPRKILDDTGWYPQVLGTGPDTSDTLAGSSPRLYIYGQSRWQLIFKKGPPPGADTTGNSNAN